MILVDVQRRNKSPAAHVALKFLLRIFCDPAVEDPREDDDVVLTGDATEASHQSVENPVVNQRTWLHVRKVRRGP